MPQYFRTNLTYGTLQISSESWFSQHSHIVGEEICQGHTPDLKMYFLESCKASTVSSELEEFLEAVGVVLLDCRNPTAKPSFAKGPFLRSSQTSVSLFSNRWR